MLSSTAIEVAIGLVFLYWLFSVFCSVLNEWIASLLALRARTLEAGIANLLHNPQEVQSKLAWWRQAAALFVAFPGLREILDHSSGLRNRLLGLTVKPAPATGRAMPTVQDIYHHGLIAGLSRKGRFDLAGDGKPSYIPSRTFALALIDRLSATPTREFVERAQSLVSSSQAALASLRQLDPAATQEIRALIRELPTQLGVSVDDLSTSGRAIMEAADLSDLVAKLQAVNVAVSKLGQGELRDADVTGVADALRALLASSQDVEHKIGSAFETLQRTVSALPQSDLQQALLVFLDDAKLGAQTDADALLKARKNIEAWFDDEMDRVSGWYKRNAQKWAAAIAMVLVLLLNIDTVAIGQKLWHDPQLRSAINAAAQAQLATPTPGPTPTTGPTPTPVPNATPVPTPRPDLGQLVQEIESDTYRSLPLGWTSSPLDVLQTGWGGTLSKVLGLALSTIALWLGAPFWFDVLKGLGSLKSTGQKPPQANKSAGGPEPNP